MAPKRVAEVVVVDCWWQVVRGVVRVAGERRSWSAAVVWFARWVTVAQ
jgi:hypothetical protein